MMTSCYKRLSLRLSLCLGLIALIGFSPAVHALRIHYSETRFDELKACDAMAYTGDRDGFTQCVEPLLDHEDVLLRADAAAALGDVRNANKWYREAAAQSEDPRIKTHWAQLYIDTHQLSDAISLYREVLLMNADYTPALIGVAEATMQSFEGAAKESLQQVVLKNPDNVKALILLARIEIELQNLTRARGLLNRAEPLLEAQGLPLLEVYALRAGVQLLEAKPIDEWVNKALAYNPNYGDIYAIPAHYYIITYRYREAVNLYQKAVDTDPLLATAHRDLGINFLRINNVFSARYHLQQAYELDPFDAQTVNTLRFLDKADAMQISSVDVPDPDNAERTLGRVLFRLDKEDVDSLEPYVIDLATRAVQVFSKRYDFTLKQPMIVELYHEHDDFAVRTVSTPGIGLLGVTFGYLTAMDSPKARAQGDFHWGSTLWHEIAHVFTLEASDHLLPRWFSEGLSVYEEWQTGPLPNRELPIDTLIALAKQQFLPIRQLDWGFVRPSYNGQVHVSYMQAGLICDFIAQEWGHQALVSMLKSFAKGESTNSALLKAIQMDGQEFDVLFNEHIESLYGELSRSLDEYQVAGKQIGRAVNAEDWVSVEYLAEDFIEQYPQRVGPGNGYEVLAHAQRQQNDIEKAIQTLLTWQSLGGHNPSTLQELIRALREAGREAQAARIMEALNWVSPYNEEEHQWLGEYYLSTNNAAKALREFDALEGLQADDPATALLGKARASLLLGENAKAKRQVLYALENAPFYRQAQRLLLELNEGEQVD